MSNHSPGDAPEISWGRLLGYVLSKSYLVAFATLAAIAILPSIFGWHSTVVQTGSMMTNIAPGDVTALSPWDRTDPVPIDGVVQFVSPAEAEPDGVERHKLHRIVEVNEDGTFMTAGDANRDVDSVPITRDSITGQGRLLIPFVGLPALWLETGRWLMLAGWASLTTLAILLAVRGPEAPTAPSTRTKRSKRPVALPVVGVLVLGLAAGTGAPQSTAAFSDTTSADSTWSVRSAPDFSIGKLADYLLFAGKSIDQIPAYGSGTKVDGSVATSPGSSVSGFAPWTIDGSVELNTAKAKAARADALALAGALDRQPVTRTIGSRISGKLTPGVYRSATGSFVIDGTVHLNAQGDPDARFVFLADHIKTSPAASVVLAGKADGDHVFWRSSGTVDIGSSNNVRGVFLASGEASIGPLSRLNGRMVSLHGSIDINRSKIIEP